MEKEIKDIKKNLNSLKEKEKNYEKEIVIQNIYSKLEKGNERTDVLEKKVKYAIEKMNMLNPKLKKNIFFTSFGLLLLWHL